MASNDPQAYIDPIIRTIFAQQQGALQKRGQEEAERRNKEQEQQARDDAKQRQEQFKESQKLSEAQLALSKANAEFQHRQAGFENLLKSIGLGAKPEQVPIFDASGSPSAPAPGFKDPLTGEVYNQSLFVGPEQLAKNKINEARGIAEAQLQVEEPFRIRSEQRDEAAQNRLLDKRFQQDERLATLNNDARERLNRQDIESREKIANLNASIDAMRIRQASKIALETGSPEVGSAVEGYIDNLAITGGINNISQIPAKVRNTVVGEIKDRGWVIPRKEDAEVLKNITLGEQMFDLLNDWAEVDTGVVSGLQSYTKLGDSPSAQFASEYEATLTKFAQILGSGERRISDQDAKLLRNAHRVTASPASNKATAQDLYNRIIVPQIQAVMAKYPFDQALQIFVKNGVDPSKYLNMDENGYEKDPKAKSSLRLSNGLLIDDTPANRRLVEAQ